MFRVCCLFAGLALAVTVVGCKGKVQEISVPTSDALTEAKGLLEKYAGGQPLMSEAADFPRLVENVKKIDPAKGDVLEKGLKDLEKASPSSRPGVAKELLKKL